MDCKNLKIGDFSTLIDKIDVYWGENTGIYAIRANVGERGETFGTIPDGVEVNHDELLFSPDEYFIGIMGFETLNKMNAIGFIALNNTCVDTIYRAIEVQTRVEETVTTLAEETAQSNFIITCLVSLVIFIAFIGCGLCCMPISRIIYREKITNA